MTKISYKNWAWLGIGMMLACCAVWPYAYGCKDDEKDIAVTGVSVDSLAVTFTAGEPQSVTATVLPREANQKVTWSSDNIDIATVDSTGLITPVPVGRTTVTATSESDRTKEASVAVTVKIFPELANRQVTWRSQNTGVATIGALHALQLLRSHEKMGARVQRAEWPFAIAGGILYACGCFF